MWKSLLLTLWIGFAATLISLAIVVAIFARFHGSLVLAAMRRMLSPLLAVPHVAVAIGLVSLWLRQASSSGCFRHSSWHFSIPRIS